MVITKLEDVTKQGFCKILWRKLRLRGSLLLARIHFFSVGRWKGVGGGGRLFEAGCLLTFSAFRMGAYSRWALIRDWAPIPINTVSLSNVHFFSTSVSQKRKIIDCEEIPAVNSGTPNSVVTTLTNIENIIRRTYWNTITEETVWRLLRKNRVR